MAGTSAILFINLIVGVAFTPSWAKGGFLSDRTEVVQDSATFDEDVAVAVAEAIIGCGGEASVERLDAVEKALLPMWATMPKIGGDRVEALSLRRLAYRYFARHFSIMIRGFEPSRMVNRSHWGIADILSERVPTYVESVLQSRHVSQQGFTLRDAATLVTILDNLISDSDGALLQKVYKEHRKPLNYPLSQRGVSEALVDYMVHWMVADDPDSVRHLLANRSLLHDSFPHWSEIVDFVHGQVKSYEFARKDTRTTASSTTEASNVLRTRYTFTDAQQVLGGLTRSFASFWESECNVMKMQLVDMDVDATGRVPLALFYQAGMQSEWRFGESEAYLRELGALDDSSRQGPKVIIPNYMQGASNCIIPTSHYLVCCASECETILGDLEEAIQAPVATVEEILSVIGNMTKHTRLDEADPVHLTSTLTSQLRKVADAHGGKVPLQGRLFAQWLHYVFPRECPFPHKAGLATSQTPNQFGDQYLASSQEMRTYAMQAKRSAPGFVQAIGNDTEWMAQWSHEEELIGEYGELRAPWESQRFLTSTMLLFILGLAAGVISLGRAKNSRKEELFGGKTHTV